ncbi:MAG: DNA mismatch repair endonuclease MutL [Pirellulales bacterium]
MPIIRQLPPSLVNKIAAGEVIERPASVVKELLENSIDAGATSIELTIEGGGMELIRISDNGCGIEAEQIPLALASHATSKLETADDLFDVHTLGFRGEALASIAEISYMTMRSRTADTNVGAEIQVRGGAREEVAPAGCPVGTTIEVRNLFFNTPVRKKFLRSPQTEASHISEAFTRIALAFPQVQFKLLTGSRVTFDLPPTDSWKTRIRAFFGEEISDSLIAIESEIDGVKLTGYVADPSVSRSNNRMQYLFLNGRHIRDRSLQHALSEAYRGLLMTGRFPVCFLRLEIPPTMVDVNVHPTKMEVRFLEGGKLYSQLLQTLRHEFLTTDLTARARHVPGPLPAGLREPIGTGASSGFGSAAGVAADATMPASADESRWQDHTDRMTQVPTTGRLDLQAEIPPFRPFPGSASLGGLPSPTALLHSQGVTATASSATSSTGVPFSGASSLGGPGTGRGGLMDFPPVPVRSTLGTDAVDLPEGAETWLAGGQESQADFDTGSSASSSGGIFQQHTAHDTPSRSHLGIQVHNRYLVTQDEQGMVVVDQHALHERILYEQLRERTANKSLESQRLLLPEPIDLTPAEAAAAIEFREVLAKIGIEVEAFGGDTVLMTSYPAMLANMRPAEVLRQVLEPLMSGGKEPSAREVLDELLHMIACKAAIKAGDRLSPEEITSLLEQRYMFQDTHHCPHGRPTALFFSREQLDKMFKRT